MIRTKPHNLFSFCTRNTMKACGFPVDRPPLPALSYSLAPPKRIVSEVGSTLCISEALCI